MHRLRTKCTLVYKTVNRKMLCSCTAIVAIIMVSGLLFLSTGKGQKEQTGLIDFMEIPEDMWTEVEWKDEAPVAHDFFRDPNQKYLHHSFTDDAALAVTNYANRSRLEESEWELRRLYDRGDLDKIAAFVKSDKGRELYLYANDDIDRIQYLLAVDVKEGEGLTYTLGNGRCSYDSDLEWTTYKTLPNKDRENGLYTFTWDEEAWIFDSGYLKESTHAMEAYLTAVQAPKSCWKLLDDELYTGANGYLVDIWYTNGAQEAHLLIDIWNKQYVMIEVIPSGVSLDIPDTSSKRQIPSYTMQEETWTRLDEFEETWDEFFINAGEWHYAAGYEQLAARAVQDYAEKNKLESEWWFLRRMHQEDGSLSAYVCSGTGRELYLLLDEELQSYLVTVDWKIKELPESGERYQYSEDSQFVWSDYRKWYDMEQEGQDPDVDFHIIGDDGCYEHNFWNWSAYALKDYLYSVSPDNKDTWVCMQESFYMGKNQCIGDIWYTNQETKIHMLVNMYNAEYLVLEVFCTEEQEEKS